MLACALTGLQSAKPGAGVPGTGASMSEYLTFDSLAASGAELVRSYYQDRWFTNVTAQCRMAMSIVLMLAIDFRLSLLFLIVPLMLVGRSLLYRVMVQTRMQSFQRSMAVWVEDVHDLLAGASTVLFSNFAEHELARLSGQAASSMAKANSLGFVKAILSAYVHGLVAVLALMPYLVLHFTQHAKKQ